MHTYSYPAARAARKNFGLWDINLLTNVSINHAIVFVSW